MNPEGLGEAGLGVVRIRASELERMLLDPWVPDSRIRPYLRLDRVGSTAFRPRVVVDPATVEDCDEASLLALCSLERLFDWRRSCRYQRRIRTWKGPRLVAQGDSWVRFPFLVTDLVEHLSRRFAVDCVGVNGSLGDAMVRQALLKAVAADRPDAVILSNGADEMLAAGLEEGTDDLVTERGRDGADSGGLLSRLIENCRRVAIDALDGGAGRVICHSYTYPVPRGGRWLGVPLASSGIAGHEAQRRVTRRLIDTYHAALERLVDDPSLRQRFVVVDCRREIGGDEWWDEVHPTDVGFGRIARRLGNAVCDPSNASLLDRWDEPAGERGEPSPLGRSSLGAFPPAQALSYSEDALLTEIGLRAEAMRLDPGLASVCAVPISFSGKVIPGLCRLGAGLVTRLERSADGLMSEACEADEVDRERLHAACGRAGSERVAGIASALVAGFGISPSIAPLVAVVLCRRGAPERWATASRKRLGDAMDVIARLARDI